MSTPGPEARLQRAKTTAAFLAHLREQWEREAVKAENRNARRAAQLNAEDLEVAIDLVQNWIDKEAERLEARWIGVTAASHPTLFEAFETISHDSGGSAGWEVYKVPKHYAGKKLDSFEVALAKLNGEDLQTFCIGADHEASAICEAHNLKAVHAFLTKFFESQSHWPREGPPAAQIEAIMQLPEAA